MNADVTDLRWLRRAVRSLDDPPAPPGWNLPAIIDGLDPALPQRDAAAAFRVDYLASNPPPRGFSIDPATLRQRAMSRRSAEAPGMPLK